jgi:phosphate transport system permease protein
MSKTAAQTRALVEKSLRRRYWAERRFRAYGLSAVLLGIVFVFFLFGTIVSRGYSAFQQAYLTLDIHYDPAIIDPDGQRAPEALAGANYNTLVRNALRELFPDVQERADLRALSMLVSTSAAHELQARVQAHPELIGHHEKRRFLAGADVDQLLKGAIDRHQPEGSRVLSDRQIGWIDRLQENAGLQLNFNRGFLSHGYSR